MKSVDAVVLLREEFQPLEASLSEGTKKTFESK